MTARMDRSAAVDESGGVTAPAAGPCGSPLIGVIDQGEVPT